jgi:transposase
VLIPLSVPEVRRLLLALDAAEEERTFRLGWSRWRRAHQAIAQRCHVARRTQLRAALPLVLAVTPPTRGALTAAEWERVRSLLPPQRPSVGRPNHDHRTVLSSMLWVLRTPAPWREMPACFGKPNAAFVRYRLWCRQGLWQRIIDALGPDAPPARRRLSTTMEPDL